MSEFLRSYLTVVVFVGAAVAMVGAMLGVGSLVRPTRPQPEKYITYESGVDPVGSMWSQSEVRYYIFAILFLIFDVEVVFLFPVVTVLYEIGWAAFVEVFFFIAILILGLAYAWRFGNLDWIRSGEIQAPEEEEQPPI